MEYRKYQSDAVASIWREWSSGVRGVMLVSPTGSGKTVMSNAVITEEVKNGGRVLFLAHRRELLTQTQEKLWRTSRIPGALIQSGKMSDYQMPVQIASVQTLKNRRMPAGITMVVTDEAHHATAETYQFIYSHFPVARMLGLTATPWRLSGKGFTDTFGAMVQSISVRELEKQGYLAKAKQAIVPMNRAAFEKAVHLSSTGDYKLDELGAFMSSDPMVRVAISSWQAYAEGKQTVVFAASVEQSMAMVSEFRRIGVAAVHIDGKTKDYVRAANIRDFTNGRFKVLVNVGIATEGTDIPQIGCVLLARPTKSLSLYLQMVGRGSRVLPGKDHYNLIDISDNILEHGHPNKEQAWTLGDWDVRAWREYERWFRVLLPDGGVIECPRSKVPNVPGIKVLEVARPGRVKDFDTAMLTVKKKGYKPMSAYHAFIRAHGAPTAVELKYMQQQLGMNDAWYKYRCLEHGISL